MTGSFASLPSPQCSSKRCHTWSLVTLDFFFVCLYKQETGYLVNPGHLDMYSGASGDNAPCLSPTAWCADQCSSSVPFPLPWHTTATAQLVLRSVTGIATRRIRHKTKLWHTGSNTKSNWSLQLSGGCTALQMCIVHGMKRYTTMPGVVRFKKENNPVSLCWMLVSGQKWLTPKCSQYSYL